MKRRLLVLGKAVASVALIGWVLTSIDRAALADTLHRLSAGPLLLAAALLVAQAVIVAWRWHRIVYWLRGRLAPADAVRWVFTGMFFNSALPTSVGGDAVRIWLLKRSGQSLALSASSVVIERGTGVVLFGLLITLCMPVVWTPMAGYPVRWLLLAAGPLLLAGVALVIVADKLTKRLLPARLAQMLLSLSSGLRRLALQPKALTEVVALGLVAALIGFLAVYVVGRDLGIDLPLTAYVVIVGGALLLSLIPVSLGGWGLREWGMVSLFASVGIDAERALALSVAWGLLPLLVSLPAGFLWWAGRARTLDTWSSDASAADRDAAALRKRPDRPAPFED